MDRHILRFSAFVMEASWLVTILLLLWMTPELPMPRLIRLQFLLMMLLTWKLLNESDLNRKPQFAALTLQIQFEMRLRGLRGQHLSAMAQQQPEESSVKT